HPISPARGPLRHPGGGPRRQRSGGGDPSLGGARLRGPRGGGVRQLLSVLDRLSHLAGGGGRLALLLVRGLAQTLMEMLALLAVFGGLGILTVGIGVVAQQLGYQARRKRRARKTPIRPIADGRKNELIRVRGVLRSAGPSLRLPFTGETGLMHF